MDSAAPSDFFGSWENDTRCITLKWDGTYINESHAELRVVVRGTWENCGPLGVNGLWKSRRRPICICMGTQSTEMRPASLEDLGAGNVLDEDGFTYSMAKVEHPSDGVATLIQIEPPMHADSDFAWAPERAEHLVLAGRKVAEPIPREIESGVGRWDLSVPVPSEWNLCPLAVHFLSREPLHIHVSPHETVATVQLRVNSAWPEVRPGDLRLLHDNRNLDPGETVGGLHPPEVTAIVAKRWVRSKSYYDHDDVELVRAVSLKDAEDHADTLAECIAFARNDETGYTYFVKRKIESIELHGAWNWIWYDKVP